MPTTSGTFLFVGVTNIGIFVASDSRASTDQNVTDDATKILQCGSRGACAICGTCLAENDSESSHGKKWSLYEILAGVRGRPAGDAKDRARFVAQQIYRSSRPFFDGYREQIKSLQRDHSGEWVCLAVFAVLYSEWSRDGTASVIRIRFPMTAKQTDGTRWLNSLGEPVIEPLHCAPQGNVYFCQEPSGREPVFPGEPPLAADVNGVVAWFSELFRLTAEQSPEARKAIGGPTDVALIDNSGFRWLSHK
jgi:hypothetical protein